MIPRSALPLLRLLGGLAPALFLAPVSFAADAASDLQEVEKRLEAELDVWLEFKKQARLEEERAECIAAFPREDFVPALTAIAGEAAGTDIAARAWMDLYRLGALLDDHELFERALGRIVDEHLGSTVVPGLSLDLVYGAPPWSAVPAAAGLRKIAAGSPLADVRLNAQVGLAMLVGLDETFGEDGRREAAAILERIESEHGDADLNAMNGRQFAAGARHEIEHLRVGQVAPDFEAVDAEGNRFRLADYRGQVVVLDFWGFV